MQQSGRSMVEMLGVLAIVGVLSIGALAGFNKAMEYHKLNVHKTAFDTLLLNAIILSNKVDDASLNGNTVLYRLNQIPSSITYQNGWLYDNFQNPIKVYYQPSGNAAGYRAGIYIDFQNNSESIKACVNMVKSAQEISSELWQIERTKGTTQSGANSGYTGQAFGDQYCQSGRKCLKNLTANDILKLCQNDNPAENTESFRLYIMWHPN